MTRCIASLALSGLVWFAFASMAAAQAEPAAPVDPPQNEPDASAATAQVDPKWLDRIPKEDRAAIDQHIGYGPPAFTSDLKWLTADTPTWGSLRGKVIVLQSWTTGNTAARGWPMRIANALKDFEPKDLRIIALHTPEKADAAEDFMKRQKPPEGVDVVIDPSGSFCDAFGIFKHPVNYIIDRNGAVRYAGLNLNGLKQAVAQLIAEPFDRSKVAQPRPQEEAASEAAENGPGFPPTSGTVTGATDYRNKRAPEFFVESWYTRQPNAQGKVVVLSFWSIDDAASRGVHQHLNQLAQELGNQVVIVAISQESRSNFEQGLMEHNMSKSDFQYAVALDRSRRMAGALNITQLPHAIVMGKDWTVRWQGSTGELRGPMLRRIVEADAAAKPQPVGKPAPRRGWQKQPDAGSDAER